ncbi:hypothetical protein GQR58_029201 [Nymphon striatum]|nr:hypothetical protein GQR58_029201 [Nymphon striatum]
MQTAAEFEAFVEEVEPRLRRAFAGSLGVDRAADALSEAFAWGWEHRARLAQLENPVGYLFRVGQSKSRRRKRPQLPPPDRGRIPHIEPGLVEGLKSLTEKQRAACVTNSPRGGRRCLMSSASWKAYGDQLEAAIPKYQFSPESASPRRMPPWPALLGVAASIIVVVGLFVWVLGDSDEPQSLEVIAEVPTATVEAIGESTVVPSTSDEQDEEAADAAPVVPVVEATPVPVDSCEGLDAEPCSPTGRGSPTDSSRRGRYRVRGWTTPNRDSGWILSNRAAWH